MSETGQRSSASHRLGAARRRHSLLATSWKGRANRCALVWLAKNLNFSVRTGLSLRATTATPDGKRFGIQSEHPASQAGSVKITAEIAREPAAVVSGQRYGLKPARCIPTCASGFCIKTFQTYPVRAFSAMSIVIPRSIPTTSLSYQFLRGLIASTNP
jgi:hypothetical protein